MRERWQYYISSYMRVEPTEGITRSHLQNPVLPRNLPNSSDVDSENGEPRKALAYSEGLILRICLNSSKIVYESMSSEFFIYNTQPGTPEEQTAHQDRLSRRRERRAERVQEKMIMVAPWMKDLSQEEVQRRKDDAKKWFDDGLLPSAAQVEEMDTA